MSPKRYLYYESVLKIILMEDLKITTIQTPLHWQDAKANREMFESYFQKTAVTDLVILPEMFTTGFSMEAESLAEDMNGPTINWMKVQAQDIGAVITGSLIIKEESNFYNRLIWMRPDGTYAYYDKRHLFAMAGEHEHYTSGLQRLIVELKGWRVCPLICYDLRFPVWARNKDEYDLLIYTANWPEKRASDWRVLLQARSIENQAYTVGVNRSGTDGKGYNYSGDTMVIAPGPKGIIFHTTHEVDCTTHHLLAEDLITTRENLPFLIDRDEFDIRD